MRKKIFFQSSIFILLLTLTATIIHYQLILKNVDKPIVQKAPVAFSKPFHDITRFHYTRTENTRRVYTIRADRFRVQKKKLGLLRFGLIKEIVVDNATIIFYKPPDQKFNFQSLTQGLKDSNAVSGMIPKRTGKVIFSPVNLQLLSQEGKPLSAISADSATFNLKNRKVVFDQNVEIHSGNRTLNAASLSVISKGDRLIARQGVILKSPGETITSDELQTDMFLTVYSDTEKGTL